MQRTLDGWLRLIERAANRDGFGGQPMPDGHGDTLDVLTEALMVLILAETIDFGKV